MNEDYCGLCRFEKVAGSNYCSNCGRPLSVEALQIQYNCETEYEKRLKNE